MIKNVNFFVTNHLKKPRGDLNSLKIKKFSTRPKVGAGFPLRLALEILRLVACSGILMAEDEARMKLL